MRANDLNQDIIYPGPQADSPNWCALREIPRQEKRGAVQKILATIVVTVPLFIF